MCDIAYWDRARVKMYIKIATLQKYCKVCVLKLTVIDALNLNGDINIEWRHFSTRIFLIRRYPVLILCIKRFNKRVEFGIGTIDITVKLKRFSGLKSFIIHLKLVVKISQSIYSHLFEQNQDM